MADIMTVPRTSYDLIRPCSSCNGPMLLMRCVESPGRITTKTYACSACEQVEESVHRIIKKAGIAVRPQQWNGGTLAPDSN
jgi:hypothetical protein